MTRPWVGLIGWLLATLATGAAGAVASRNAREFYVTLVRPTWSPPGWVFGPVWTTLYILMGIAAWLVWRDVGWKGASTALSLFVVQLLVNAAWSWFFFAWRRGDPVGVVATGVAEPPNGRALLLDVVAALADRLLGGDEMSPRNIPMHA